MSYSINSQETSAKIKVLIVDGFNNHNWQGTSVAVKEILESSGLFKVAISTIPIVTAKGGDNNWNPDFTSFDVLIQNTNNINDSALRWPRNVEIELEHFIKSGGGMFALHSANNAFSEWQEYNRMIGLGWRKPEEGVALQVEENGRIKVIPVGEGSSTYHGPRKDALIHIFTKHPIHKGFPEKWMTPDMELYKYARGPAQNTTVLSYATDSDTNINWPVEWVVAYGKGRVYSSSMGHFWKNESYPISYRCVGFRTTLIRAVEWLASGKTTTALPASFPNSEHIQLTSD